MNADEIVKALRICVDNECTTTEEKPERCKGCYLEKMPLVDLCVVPLKNDAADLLEQFQAKVERMGIIIDKYQGEIVPNQNERIEQQQEEIEQLKVNQPVRCGECKHFGSVDNGRFCDIAEETDYCSYGGRREG